MNCHIHTDHAAVAQSPDCHRGLCSSCSSSYSIPICPSCGNKRIRSEKWSIIKGWLITLLAGLIFMVVLGAVLITPGGEHKYRFFSSALLLFYISCGVVPGWKALTSITPNMFLFLPLLGWVLYFVIKFMLAIAIGWIILPFKLIKDVMRFVQLSKM